MTTSTTTPRIAIIESDRDSLENVQRYLPGNYNAVQTLNHGILIIGEDVAGWTMDDYVIPRLASGLIFARELEGLRGDFS